VATALSPADHERIELQLRLFGAARALLPQDPFPHYLGHVRFAQRGRLTDVLLVSGPRSRSGSLAGAGIIIADWLESAYAEVFFAGIEGKPLRATGGARSIRGTVIERNVVGFQQRELVDVITANGVLSRRDTGEWRRRPHHTQPLVLRSPEAKRQEPSLIDVHLDPAQRAIVELPHGKSVLVLGEAGHGKTTVALHRLAALQRSATGRFRVAVIVPGLGLRRLLSPLMDELGVKADVRVYDRWAVRQALRAFPGLPSKESQSATASVIRLKRDPALRIALSTLARRRPGRIDDARHAHTLSDDGWASRGDLQHLFGDKKLMTEVIRASRDPVGAHGLTEILEHTRIQFSRATERELAHVDKARLRTLDGRPIDDGTPLEDAGSIDAEDCAVLFEIDRLRAERRRKSPTLPRAYDCIVLDEAQELAPLELRLIGRSLARGGTLIVAGDADQQTDPAAFFAGWEQTMTELACSDYEKVVLGVNYRCPPAVVRVARRLMTPNDGSTEIAHAEASDCPFTRFINECDLVSWLVDELRRLARRDPRASVAVICRAPATARRLTRALRHATDAKLVLDGRFVYRSGVNVTTVDQVKGLEFDYVIVPDASELNYPDQPTSRRALYVAVTRARHQLVLGAVARRTHLLSS
jgi:DNA helicase-2/ATP-dependent DNA helicase PcrA